MLSCFRCGFRVKRVLRFGNRKKIRRTRRNSGSPVGGHDMMRLCQYRRKQAVPPPFIIRCLDMIVFPFIVVAFPLGRKRVTNIARIFRSANFSALFFCVRAGRVISSRPPAGGASRGSRRTNPCRGCPCRRSRSERSRPPGRPTAGGRASRRGARWSFRRAP